SSPTMPKPSRPHHSARTSLRCCSAPPRSCTGSSTHALPVPSRSPRWANGATDMKREIALGGVLHPVTLMRRDGSAVLSFAGRSYPYSLREIAAGEYLLSMSGKTHRVWIATHRSLV